MSRSVEVNAGCSFWKASSGHVAAGFTPVFNRNQRRLVSVVERGRKAAATCIPEHPANLDSLPCKEGTAMS